MFYRRFLAVVFSVNFLLMNLIVFAQTPPAVTPGELLRQEEDARRMLELEERIRVERKKPDRPLGPEDLIDDDGEKILITKIIVEDVTLLPEKAIEDIIVNFEGKELSLRAMQMAADLITDEYRKRGFATSRAFIPPQELRDGILTIRVIEGRLGDLEIRGNRYFSSRLLERLMDADTDGYFDFSQVQSSLNYINEHPDRNARLVLVPGQEPGTTDIILEVEDRLPIHAGYHYDNYLSNFFGERQWTAFVEHNNLLGLDDKLRFEYRSSFKSELYSMWSFRYLFPINKTLESGAYFSKGRSKLGRDFSFLDYKGDTLTWGMYLRQQVYTSDDIDLRLTAGFDYKDVENTIAGEKLSEDNIRIVKMGADLDINDRWGRSIMTIDYQVGIPGMLGGMSAKGPLSSRQGANAGGKFQKWVFNLFRLQPMPLDTQLLWKTSAQVSNHNLVSGEQFQIGGPLSVRGYGPGEQSGDQGVYMGLEWTAPCYFFPRSWTIPFTKGRTFYDSIRILAFYDWGQVYTKTPATGEKKVEVLRSVGPGLRLNISENLFARVEFGYPLHGGNKNPANGRSVQPWFEINAKF